MSINRWQLRLIIGLQHRGDNARRLWAVTPQNRLTTNRGSPDEAPRNPLDLGTTASEIEEAS